MNDLGTTLDGAGTAQGPAAETCRLIEDAGGKAVANGESVADFDGAGRIIAQAVDTFGSIDILVNNAGIVRDRTLVKMTSEDYDAVVAVHQKGTFNCTRHAARAHARGGVRPDREHHVVGGPARQLRPEQLRRRQGRHHGHDLRLGARARQVRHHGQRRGPRRPHPHDREPVRRGRRAPDQDPALNAPLVAFLASEQAGYVNGQVLGRTGYAYTIFQTPRQVAAMWREGGWTPTELAEHFHEVLGQHLQPVGMPAHPLLGKKDGG